ncbi:MAG: hypothetical protein Q9227_003454 [Pyrenula ochraceoflavens]
MKLSSPGTSILSLLLAASLTQAWPKPFDKIGSLVLRQDSSSTDGSSSASASQTAAQSSDASSSAADSTITSGASASASGSSASASGSAAATTGASGSKETGKATKTNKSSSQAAKTTDFDPRLPPGGVQMMSPAPTEGSQYFKVGDFVTFKWNYTSLSVTPSAIDIMASCSLNSQLYTLALNQSVKETGAVTWDTGEYQRTASLNGQPPLAVETYTLVIYDAALSVSATAKAGYLGAFDQYTFGMYTPQPYVPLNGE